MTNNSQIAEQLESIFRQVFRKDSLEISDNLTASEVDTWDSLSHVDMIVMVEESFGIQIPTLKAAQLKNVGELVALISELKAG